MNIVVIKDRCIGCGNCTNECPMDAITFEEDIIVVNKELCVGCGVCVGACPANAIEEE